MKKLLLAIFLAITIFYISPLEASAGETGTFFSVQYTSGYGHGGGIIRPDMDMDTAGGTTDDTGIIIGGIITEGITTMGTDISGADQL